VQKKLLSSDSTEDSRLYIQIITESANDRTARENSRISDDLVSRAPQYKDVPQSPGFSLITLADDSSGAPLFIEHEDAIISTSSKDNSSIKVSQHPLSILEENSSLMPSNYHGSDTTPPCNSVDPAVPNISELREEIQRHHSYSTNRTATSVSTVSSVRIMAGMTAAGVVRDDTSSLLFGLPKYAASASMPYVNGIMSKLIRLSDLPEYMREVEDPEALLLVSSPGS
jgi:hypothetical protein